MKTFLSLTVATLIAGAHAGDRAMSATTFNDGGVHRYLIERPLPASAVEVLDAATKERFDRTNASVGVRWIQSYANAQQTPTFCVYEGRAKRPCAGPRPVPARYRAS